VVDAACSKLYDSNVLLSENLRMSCLVDVSYIQDAAMAATPTAFPILDIRVKMQV